MEEERRALVERREETHAVREVDILGGDEVGFKREHLKGLQKGQDELVRIVETRDMRELG